MRKLFITLIAAGLFAVPAWSQTGPQENEAQIEEEKSDLQITREKVEVELSKLFEFAERRNYREFAKMKAYTGSDPNRQLQDLVNYDNPMERVEVENLMNLIIHWLDRSMVYQVRNFRIAQGLNTEMYFFEVAFTSEKGKTQLRKFAFVDIGGNYCLANALKK